MPEVRELPQSQIPWPGEAPEHQRGRVRVRQRDLLLQAWIQTNLPPEQVRVRQINRRREPVLQRPEPGRETQRVPLGQAQELQINHRLEQERVHQTSRLERVRQTRL